MTGMRKPSDLLRPLTSAIKEREIAVYDIESKGNSYRQCFQCQTRNDYLPDAKPDCQACGASLLFCKIIDTQEKGFSRAFMVSFYDGDIFRTFRNLPQCMDKPWQERAVADGGCVDQFLRFLFEERHDASASEGLRGSTKKYQSKRFNIYAHNGGKFDHEFVLAWLLRNRHLWEFNNEAHSLADEVPEEDIEQLEKEYGFEISAVQSKIQRLDIWPRGRKKEQGYWSFLDSISLLPMSLKKAAEQFNAPQFQKMKFDLDLPEEDNSWEEYNKYDCQALYHALKKFGELVVNDLGGEVGMTAAATSMKLYRRHYQKQSFVRNAHFSDCLQGCLLDRDGDHGCEQRSVCDGHCHGCAHRWIHSGYFGGRTELFSPYGCPIHYFDINSSYAASMLEPMPIGRMTELNGPRQFSKYADSGKYCGFIECTVYIPDSCHIPPLPWREPTTGKTLFPACGGRNTDQLLTGVFSWEELKLLADPLVGGKILTIYRSVWYEAFPVFAEMMMDLFAIREKYGKSSPLGFLAKLLGNSLYGKFAMREERSKLTVLDVEEKFRPGMIPINGDFEHDVLWDEEVIAHANYIIPQISAHITALARVRLFRAMMDILRASGNIYYCDSITPERCVVVQDDCGRTKVMPVDRLWSLAQSSFDTSDGKETAVLKGWKALARDSNGNSGWFPLKRLIRHETTKPIHLVSTKEGQTCVTEDHGIMVGNKAVNASDFVSGNCDFEKIEIPSIPCLNLVVDLFEEIQHCRVVYLTKYGDGPYKEGSFSFTTNDEGDRIVRTGDRIRKTDGSFLRYYKAGSDELHSLLRVIAAFVSEGSASLHGELLPKTANFEVVKATRNMFSISQNKKEWLEDIKSDLEQISSGFTLTVIESGATPSGMNHCLRNGATYLPFLFASLCGEGHSRNRRLPQFVFSLSKEDFLVLWRKILEGDGYHVPVELGDAYSYTTQSLELASQLSCLLNMHGIDHAFHYREEKQSWCIRTRKSVREGRTIGHVVNQSYQGFVYDLEVEGAHTFVDALGQVLLHNTDSIISSILLPPDSQTGVSRTGEKLGEWKQEDPGIFMEGEFILPKLYRLRSKNKVPFEKEHTKECLESQKQGDAAAKKCKGCALEKFRMKGVGAPTPEKWDLMVNQRAEIEFPRVMQHRTLMKENFMSPIEVIQKKSIRTTYDKRILEGSTSRPLLMGVDVFAV